MKPIYSLFLVVLITSFVNAQNILDHYIFVKVEIEGEEYKLLFDNGFTRSAIFSESPIRTKLKSAQGKDGFDQKVSLNYTKKKIVLELLDFDLTYKLRLIILPNAPKLFVENGIDGVLGWDIISQHDWVVNFDDRSLQLSSDDDLPAFENAYKIPLVREMETGDWLDLTVNKLNGNEENFTFQPQLDFGYSGFINCGINELLADKIDKNVIKIGKAVSIVKARIDTSYYQQLDLKMGEINMTNVPIQYYSTEKSPLLGIKFLESFDKVALVYSKQTLYLPQKESIVFTLPNILTHQGAIKSVMTTPTEMDDLKWKIGDLLSPTSEVIIPDAFKWKIQLNKKD